MTAIVVKAFNGLKPISNTLLLDPSDATVANNVLLISGSLRPLKETTKLKPLTKVGAKTIYRYDPENDREEGDYWLEFMEDTDVMRSPIAQDQWDRLYWTKEVDGPRYASKDMVIGGGGSLPGASYELGVPESTTAPTVTSFTEPEVIKTVPREYTMSLYADVPGAPVGGPPGAVLTVQAVDGKPVKFTNLTTDNRGDMRVTNKIIWRKVDLEWRIVAVMALAQTDYEDVFTDEEMKAKNENGEDVHPVMPPTYANSSAAPQYPPIVSAGEAKALVAISREYAYTLADYYEGGKHYDESPLSFPPIEYEVDESQTITLVDMLDHTGTATYFNVYRKDANKPGYLLLQQLPISQTQYTDVIATSNPQIALGKVDGPTAPQAPTTGGTPSTGGTVVKRIYMVTFVNVSGNESHRSPESEVVSVVDGKTEVALHHNEPIPDGVSKKRLYRQDITLSSGVIVSNDANWKFVAENSASATQAVDVIPDAQLPGSGYAPELQNAPPAPKGAPSGKAEVPASVVPESRVYVFTYVTVFDEEGAPSPSSEVISCDPAKPVTLSLPGAPSGDYNITKKRIYRSATGTARTKFQYVGETNAASSTFVDDVRTAALGELLPSDGWIPPPKGLRGLRMMANGCAVGFLGNALYFSEPNLPHAWPHEYPIDDQIVAIGTFGQSVVVLTNNYPYLFSGIDPAAMASTKMHLPQACSSKRSIVETGDGVLYASPDGMTMIGQSTSVVTLNILSRELWQSYNPNTMEAFIHNGRVIVVYENPRRGILILDISGAGALMTTSDINDALHVPPYPPITAGHYSPQRDILYFAQGGDIVRFDSGLQALTATWRSKLFRQGMQHNFGWAQVFCKSYAPNPEAFFYADGVLRYSKTITSGEPFRLPSGFRALDWEIELQTRTEVTEVLMASSSAQLQVG